MEAIVKTTGASMKWLACRIDKGMFSDELAVTYPPDGKKQKSVFVSRSSIRGNEGQTGKVQVLLIDQGGGLLAVLPSAYRDIVTVRGEEDLSE